MESCSLRRLRQTLPAMPAVPNTQTLRPCAFGRAERDRPCPPCRLCRTVPNTRRAGRAGRAGCDRPDEGWAVVIDHGMVAHALGIIGQPLNGRSGKRSPMQRSNGKRSIFKWSIIKWSIIKWSTVNHAATSDRAFGRPPVRGGLLNLLGARARTIGSKGTRGEERGPGGTRKDGGTGRGRGEAVAAIKIPSLRAGPAHGPQKPGCRPPLGRRGMSESPGRVSAPPAHPCAFASASRASESQPTARRRRGAAGSSAASPTRRHQRQGGQCCLA
jgi:hypothetical protein